MRTHPIPASKMTRPILSSRIPQARSPRRTSFATADSTGAFSVSPLSMAMGTDIWRRYRAGREVQVAPGEDVQPRSPARRCTRGRTCSDWGNGWAHRQHCRRRADHRLRDRQPCWLPHRAVSGALDQSVDGPHGWITKSCSRLPPDGSDCVSS
jgi:hypothetical protein